MNLIMVTQLGFTDLELIYFIGIFVGVFVLSIAPYIRKLNEGAITEWNHLYTLVMVTALTASVIASFIVFAINPLTATTPPLAFAGGLTVGLAAKPTVEELLKQLAPKWFED